MSSRADTERFVKDPGILVQLCREVIDQLHASSAAAVVTEQEAQLRAIARAVEQLEKSGISVPDPLRAEKTRLAASLSVHTDAKQALLQLAGDLQDVLTDLRDHLGQNAVSVPTERKQRVKRSKTPKTPQKVLREHIVRARKKAGGKARASEVLEEIGRQMEGKLLRGDFAIRRDGKTIAWQNNACWERLRMRKDGTLRGDSPTGIWELAKDRQ
jgi:hypothetical protein